MTEFQAKVFAAVKLIPKGKVSTYGAIAAYLGVPRAPRAVGNALHNNPEPIITPCHRVVNSLGYLSGRFAFGGAEVQKDLLISEGVEVGSDNVVDLDKFGYIFTNITQKR